MEAINFQNVLTVMTVRDVAVYLHFSNAKVYQMARGGELPAARIGRGWRFRKDLIDAWLERSSTSNLKVADEISATVV